MNQSHPLAGTRGHSILSVLQSLPHSPWFHCSSAQSHVNRRGRLRPSLGCVYATNELLPSSSVQCPVLCVQPQPQGKNPSLVNEMKRKSLKHLFCPLHCFLLFFMSLNFLNASGKVINCSVMVMISSIVLITVHTLSHSLS